MAIDPFENVQATVDWITDKFHRHAAASVCAHTAANEFNNQMIGLEAHRQECEAAGDHDGVMRLQEEIDRAEQRTIHWTETLQAEETAQRELVRLFIEVHKQTPLPDPNMLLPFDGFGEGEAH